MSSRYAAEPVPFDLEPVLAEYLNRQLQAIEVALRSDFQAPRFTKLPERKVIGALIVVRNKVDPAEDGFWACIENSQGEGEWKKLVLA
jgi:hypothetical protein